MYAVQYAYLAANPSTIIAVSENGGTANLVEIMVRRSVVTMPSVSVCFTSTVCELMLLRHADTHGYASGASINLTRYLT